MVSRVLTMVSPATVLTARAKLMREGLAGIGPEG
jgi:hypothetical protein